MPQEIPPFLREQLLSQYGEDVTAQIASGYAQRRLTSLRVNRLKAEPQAVREALAAAGIACEGVAWSGDALVLPGEDERAVAALPLLWLYNGRPGAKGWRWAFYVFYPAHLLVLEGIRALT